MRTLLICIHALLLGIPLLGQSLEREVIASSGTFFSGNNASIEWTQGEAAIATLNNPSTILTQGFHQTKLTVTAIEPSDSDEIFTDYQINVFPNPVSDRIFVEVAGGLEPVRTAITDMSGKSIHFKTEMEMGQRYEFPMDQLADGMYFVRIFNSRNQPIQTFKVVKTN